MIDYRRLLEEAADAKLSEFSSKLTPGKSGIMGVRMPVLRGIAKDLAKDDWRSFLEETPGCFEEEVLRGLVIATAPMDASERIRLTDAFLPMIDNWATCDCFCQSWKFRRSESDEVWRYFSGLMKTDQEFPMRVSVVMRMSHFMDADHVSLLLDDIQDADNEGYYYRMGAAWAVSVCYVKHPEETRAVLESGRLCDWVQNKSIQKIRESYRVPAEDKESLMVLRRRSP